MPAPSTTRPNPSKRSPWLTTALVLAVAAALIAVVLWMNRDTAPAGDAAASGAAPSATNDPEQPDLTAVETRNEGDVLAFGPTDAPVGLVVFSDYQCPFCARWSTETLPTMMQHAEAGDLRIEWRDVNVFGSASERAARAAYAAALQGAFLEYHDALFADGRPRAEAELGTEALTALARELGLDAQRFAADLTADQTAEVIAANQRFGLDLGITSTPVFILGGQPIVGAQPTQVFEDAFQAALDQAD